jgi:hypothetical protein
MAFGGANAGKSYAFYTIAKRALQTKSDAKFYVVDTDVSVGRMLSDPAFESLVGDDGQAVNIEFEDVDDWDEFITAVEKFQARMRSQDWLMLDMLGPTWDWCQGAFTDKVFHRDLDEYFLAKRAAMKNPEKDKMFEGWVDWPVINKMYLKLQNLILKSPGNLYACNESKALARDQAEKDTKALFGPHGVVPVGQKRNPHLFQTILWFTEPRPNEREVITVKDRSRTKLEGVGIRDFSIDYLVKVAGWRLV